MTAPEDRVVIGRVVKPHGLKGEVVVEVLTDFPGRFSEGLRVRLSGAGAPIREGRISGVRPQRDRLLLTFEEISDVAGAESLRNADLSVSAQDVAPRPPGFVYHWEIEGADAFDEEGRRLGRVAELVDAGGRPLLVVETPRGLRDVPFASPIVVSVDVAGRRVVLAPPEGLLD
ncbi:MAG TPA: ribosome maturation factor RimM [Thermoanaerobaculia bacterium]|nr:ribosome maturation factor RimM [Thermoanaerobaculia bacterium]